MRVIKESVVILVLCALMCSAFLRSKYSRSVLTLLPIAIIPALYLLTTGVLRLLKKQIEFEQSAVILIVSCIIALAITCIVFALLSRKIAYKKARWGYLIVMGGYSLILGCVYIFHSFGPLLPGVR